MDKRIAYFIDGKAFSSAKEAEDHAEASCTAGKIGQVELLPGQQIVGGKIVGDVISTRIVHVIDGKAFSSAEEAEEEYPSILADEVVLEPDQQVINGRIVTFGGSPEYKVTWNTQTIPFWHNFEGAKACALAINSNKTGSRARLVSFMREKEIQI